MDTEIITDAVTGEVTSRPYTQAEIDARAARAAAALAAAKDAAVAKIDQQGDILKALGAALFEVVNDVRVLKGQVPITAQQFRTYIKSKL